MSEPADYEYDAAPLVPTRTVQASVVKLDKMPGMNCDEDENEPAAPSVDLWIHEREQYRKAIEGLNAKCDELRAMNITCSEEWHRLCEECNRVSGERGQIAAERDELQKVIDGYNTERVRILGERDKLKKELATAKRDVEALNQIVRDRTGMGQGEIDGMATDIIELAAITAERDKLRTELAEALKYFPAISNIVTS